MSAATFTVIAHHLTVAGKRSLSCSRPPRASLSLIEITGALGVSMSSTSNFRKG